MQDFWTINSSTMATLSAEPLSPNPIPTVSIQLVYLHKHEYVFLYGKLLGKHTSPMDPMEKANVIYTHWN